MKYKSTRADIDSEAILSFEDVLFSPGYASDGGLFVPEFIPTISTNDIDSWKMLSYPEIVGKILRIYTSESDVTDNEIAGVVNSAFKEFELPQKVINLEKLDDGLIIAELFRGPTLAFKDLSLAVLAKLLEFFLKKKNCGRINVLVGTSGDTGPAAAHAVAGLDRVNLILLYPLNRVSEIQELQMLTITAPNVHVCAVEGNSDELDVPIKNCFQDVAFSRENSLGSFNSLQWGRIMLQAAHYIYIYIQCCKSSGKEVTIVVPTGAAGNLAAGFVAKEMGFPIKLVATVNVNDILARSFQNGDFSTSSSVSPSLAPAMDIQAPYNIERLLYFAMKGNSKLVREVMERFERNGKEVLSHDILQGLRSVIIDSTSVTDKAITDAIRRCYRENKYIACPHTATAVSYVYDQLDKSANREQTRVFVCLATASPAKFPESCLKAGVEMNSTHPRLKSMKEKAQSENLVARNLFQRGQDWTSQLKEIILKVQ